MGSDSRLSRLSETSRGGGRCSFSNFSGTMSPKGAPLGLYSNQNWQGSTKIAQPNFEDNGLDKHDNEVTSRNNNTGEVSEDMKPNQPNASRTCGPLNRSEPLHGSGVLLFETLEKQDTRLGQENGKVVCVPRRKNTPSLGDSAAQPNFRDNGVVTGGNEVPFRINTGVVSGEPKEPVAGGNCGPVPSILPGYLDRSGTLHEGGVLLFETLESNDDTVSGQGLPVQQTRPENNKLSVQRRKSLSSLGGSGNSPGGKGGEGGGVLRYALHLRFMCPPLRNHGKEKGLNAQKSSTPPAACKGGEVEDERRFYIYGDLRVVFPQRHSDAHEGKVCFLIKQKIRKRYMFLYRVTDKIVFWQIIISDCWISSCRVRGLNDCLYLVLDNLSILQNLKLNCNLKLECVFITEDSLSAAYPRKRIKKRFQLRANNRAQASK